MTEDIEVWKRFVAIGVIAAAISLAGSNAASHIIGLLVSLAALATMAKSALGQDARFHRPWFMYSAGTALILSGRGIQGIQTSFDSEGKIPFPSFGDLFFVMGYICLIGGTVALVQMKPEVNRKANLLESLLISSNLAIIIWVVVVSPYVRDEMQPLSARLANSGYIFLTLILVATGIWLVIDPLRRQGGSYLVVSSIALIFVVELLSVMRQAGFQNGNFIVPLSMLSLVSLASGFLHPSWESFSNKFVSGPSAADADFGKDSYNFRWPILVGTTLINTPAILVYQLVEDLTIDLPIVIFASIFMSALVITRLINFIYETKNITLRERALYEVGIALVAATTEEDIYMGAMDAAMSLAGNSPRVRVSLAIGIESHMVITASTGAHSEEAIGSDIKLDELPTPLANGIRDRHLVHVSECASVDIRRSAMIGIESTAVSTTIIPLGTQGGLSGALIVSARENLSKDVLLSLETLGSEISLALESTSLARDIHQIEKGRRLDRLKYKAAEMLTNSEARFRSLVQNSSDIVAIVSPNGTISYLSPSIENILGFSQEMLLKSNLFTLISGEDNTNFLTIWNEVINGVMDKATTELRILNIHGQECTLNLVITDLRHEPSVAGIVINARDVTAHHALESNLAFQALHDTQTGLGNRSMFIDHLGMALGGDSDTHGVLAVLVIDIDDFKAVNERLGHSAGDHLLRITADRLRSCLRSGDIAARLGSDEFAVMFRRANGTDEVAKVTDRIHRIISEPVEIDGKEVSITASVGIVIDPDRSSDSGELLLRNADMALYLAKQSGKDCYQIFEEKLRGRVFKHLDNRSSLQEAIQRGELILHYQPIMSLKTMELNGVEALVRWQHPERGMLMPDEFIPLAEESGLIEPLGRWVIEEACRQLRSWQQELGESAPGSVAINIASGQINNTFASEVLETLRRHKIKPRSIHLEITERTMVDEEDTSVVMNQLRAAGLQVVVDDFGTGYSSLSYLQQFPVDIIKIDKSFVKSLSGDSPDIRLIHLIMELAHHMNASPIAEGIETSEQLERLQQMGCQMGQGYFFARPVPANLMPFILTNKTLNWRNSTTDIAR